MRYPMDKHLDFVIAAYGIWIGVIGVYFLLLVRRYRYLQRVLARLRKLPDMAGDGRS